MPRPPLLAPLLLLPLLLLLLTPSPVAGEACVDSLGRAGRWGSYGLDPEAVTCGSLPIRCAAVDQPPALGEDGVWRCPSKHYALDGAKVTWPDGVHPHSEPAACKPVG